MKSGPVVWEDSTSVPVFEPTAEVNSAMSQGAGPSGVLPEKTVSRAMLVEMGVAATCRGSAISAVRAMPARAGILFMLLDSHRDLSSSVARQSGFSNAWYPSLPASTPHWQFFTSTFRAKLASYLFNCFFYRFPAINTAVL